MKENIFLIIFYLRDFLSICFSNGNHYLKHKLMKKTLFF